MVNKMLWLLHFHNEVYMHIWVDIFRMNLEEIGINGGELGRFGSG